jgi:hypothetical protein
MECRIRVPKLDMDGVNLLYLVHMLDKFVHIPEPGFSILVVKIIPHGPHDVLRTRNICLHH